MNDELTAQVQEQVHPNHRGSALGELAYRRLALLASDFVHCCVKTGLDPFRIGWVGGAVEKATGYTCEELRKSGCWMPRVHPEDAPRVGAHLMALSPGDTGEIEFRLIHKDGGVRWMCESYCCEAGGSPYESILYGSIRDITERKVMDEALALLATGGSSRSGMDFFQFLARYLAETLRMDFVCIDRLEGDGLNARTLAVYFDGHFEDNITYALKDTPCGEVVGKPICCFPRDVRGLFPGDAVLQEMGAESYVGVTLWDSAGNPSGLIAVIARQPLDNPRLAESILQLAGVRASGELERLLRDEAMAASLREKEVLLREIHHRVKNNLQIISSLLSLQEEGVDNAVTLGVLAESRGRVTSMALIHDQLYRSHDLGQIDVEEYLRQFIPRLVSTYKGGRDVSLRFELSRVHLLLDQAVPFGLIVNELVTNALKHGFKGRERGRICVTAARTQAGVCVSIEDDGEGLPGDFTLDAVHSLGLQIVRMLARQLRGTLSLEPSEGTCFCLRFPLLGSAPVCVCHA